MHAEDFRYDGSRPCRLRELCCDGGDIRDQKAKLLARTAANLAEMGRLHDALYADGREGVVVLLQALDAAGKDGVVKHVMGALNPQGVTVHSFKQPSAEELAHDYLWRVNRALPRRGSIAIFNRSYYEDVLVVQLHDLQNTYRMPPRLLQEGKAAFYAGRYRQIREYERYLYDNGYRVLKLFLHVSREEQRQRFLERIDTPEKNWKFSEADLCERARFEEYTDLFDEVITATASPHCPWYVLPADRKWYTRYLVSELVLDTLRQCCHEYPTLPEDARRRLKDYRRQLESET